MKIDRVSAIRRYVFSKTAASIHEIAEAVGASLPTVRRDLLALEAEGAIERTHGGARIADGAATEAEFEVREQTHIAAKRSIGEAAYSLIRPETTIFLDAGTTVLQVARHIRLKPTPLSVFTNCLPVAQQLAGLRDVSVTVLGGRLRARNASLLGPFAGAMLDRLWFDHLFLGVSAIGEDGCAYTPDEDEAQLNAKMVSRSARTTVLADSSKFGRRATYRVVTLDRHVDLISDDRLSPVWLERLEKAGCRVLVAAAEDFAAAGDREGDE